jgi:transposase
MPQKSTTAIAVIGIDIGKNSFHVVGYDAKVRCCARSGRAGKWKRGLPICHHACWGWRVHHLSRRLNALGHDARLRAFV